MNSLLHIHGGPDTPTLISLSINMSKQSQCKGFGAI